MNICKIVLWLVLSINHHNSHFEARKFIFEANFKPKKIALACALICYLSSTTPPPPKKKIQQLGGSQTPILAHFAFQLAHCATSQTPISRYIVSFVPETILRSSVAKIKRNLKMIMFQKMGIYRIKITQPKAMILFSFYSDTFRSQGTTNLPFHFLGHPVYGVGAKSLNTPVTGAVMWRISSAQIETFQFSFGTFSSNFTHNARRIERCVIICLICTSWCSGNILRVAIHTFVLCFFHTDHGLPENGSRTTTPWTITPRITTTRTITPKDNYPQDNYPQYDYPQDNYPQLTTPGQLPQDNYPQDDYPQDNYPQDNPPPPRITYTRITTPRTTVTPPPITNTRITTPRTTTSRAITPLDNSLRTITPQDYYPRITPPGKITPG